MITNFLKQRALLQSLLQKGSFALLEQAFFSGTTFIVNILLIRWLTATGYGAYTLAFAVLIFASGFYQVWIFEPIALYGPVKYRNSFAYYARLQSRLFWNLAIAISLFFGAITVLLYWFDAVRELQLAFLGIAIGQGGLLSFWLVRRLYYARYQVMRLSVLSSINAAIQIGSIIILHLLDILTPLSAYAVPAVFTMLIAFVGVLGLGKPIPDKAIATTVRTVIAENWQYGNWLTFSAFLNWLSNYAYFVMVGAILSIEETGALRAIQNLTLPAVQFFTVMGMLFFPWASSQFAEGGHDRLRKITIIYTAAITLALNLYYVVLLLLDDVLMQLLYGGNFGEYRYLVAMLGLIPIMGGIVTPLSLAIRISHSTLYTFLLDLSSTIVVFTISLYLTFSGLQGAVIGMLLSNSARIIVILLLWRYLSKREKTQNTASIATVQQHI